MRSADRFHEQMRVLIEAGYPASYVLTYEERRATELLQEVARSLDFQFFRYSTAAGLSQPITQGRTPDDWADMDPVSAVRFASEHGARALFAMYDLHQCFQTHEVMRALRDFCAADHDPLTRHIVVTAPVLHLPPELSKNLTVVELPLPTESELRSHIEQVIERLNTLIGFTPPDPEEIERIVMACKGLTADEYENVLAKSWARHRRIDIPSLFEEKRQIVRKSDILEYHDQTLTFDDVGGLDGFKAWIDERRDVFGEAARQYGLPTPKGALLLGIPGTGKSLLCKAVAGELGLPLIRLDMGRIFGGYIGSSEANIRKAISVVEAIAPCVLWLDELEKGLSGAGSSDVSDAGTSARVIGTFLQWMSERTAPVFLVATGNDIRRLSGQHPELFRKGRFDEIFFVDLPAASEREEIFRIHFERKRELQAKARDARTLDLPSIVAATEGYSGAEIEQVVISGLFKAFRERREPQTRDFTAAASETNPLIRTAREQIVALRRWVDGRARWASSAQHSREVPATTP